MKKILVTRSSMPPIDDYIEEIKSLWETHWLTNMGSKHESLEKKLTEFLKVPNVSLFSNGHMALELTIQALGGVGEIITTPFTFASTTHAIVRNGLTPVFCDINPENYTLDVSKIEGLINERTSAIIPVHVYGNICEVEELEEIGKKYNLKIIYDAAHAFGVEYKGRGIGTWGDASMFSFHATKVFNTIEGGAVTYANRELGKKLYQLKNFGICDEVTVDGIGANAKMNEFQAAMGLCNLKYFYSEIEKRKRVYERYLENLLNINGLTLPKIQENVKTNYAYFPIVVNEKIYGATRDEICNELKAHNIYARKYFYPLTSAFECYKGKYNNATPVATYVSEHVLTLPIYADLEKEDIDRICKILISLGR